MTNSAMYRDQAKQARKERDAALARAEEAEKRLEEAGDVIAAMAKAARLLLGYTERKAAAFLAKLETKP